MRRFLWMWSHPTTGHWKADPLLTEKAVSLHWMFRDEVLRLRGRERLALLDLDLEVLLPFFCFRWEADGIEWYTSPQSEGGT